MRRATPALLLGLALACGIACHSYGSTDDGTTPDAGLGDAAVEASEASGPAEAGTDAGEAGPNLLKNPDFALGCTGWQTNAGILTEETTEGHDQLGACRLCIAQDKARATLEQSLEGVSPGQEYFGSIWIKNAPDSGPPSSTTMDLESYDTIDENTSLGMSPESTVFVNGTWQRAKTIATVPDGATVIVHVVAIEGTGCVLFDDAELRRTR